MENYTKTILLKGAKKQYLFLSILLLWPCFITPLSSQSFLVSQYTESEGLPNNHVYQSQMDSLGFLWVITQGGLARFDGKTFRPLKVKSSDFKQSKLKVDSAGKLYFQTPGHVFEIISLPDTMYGQETATPISLFQNEAISPQEITKAYNLPQDFPPISCILKEDDVVFIGTAGKGLIKLMQNDQGGWNWEEVYSQNNIQKWDHLPFQNIHHIFQDQYSTLWISSAEGLGLLKRKLFGTFSEIPKYGTNGLTQLKNGDIYVYERYLYRIRRNKGKYTVTLDETLPEHFFPNTITSSGNDFWVSNIEGDIYKVNQGRVKKIINITAHGGNIFYLFADSDKNVWIHRAPTHKPIIGILKLKPNGELQQYGKAQGLENRILVTREAPDKTLYCAGMGRGTYLYRFDINADTFVNLSQQLPFYSVRNFEVHDMAIDMAQVIWLGTTHGLLRYQKGKIEKIQLDPRLSNEEIRGVSIGKDGSIWLATIKGLARYKNGKTVLYTESDGLLSNVINYRGILSDSLGGIWAGNNEGVSKNISPISFIPQSCPKPIITAFWANDKLYEPGQLAQKYLPFQSNVKIQFVSLFYPSEELEYQVRVNGDQLGRYQNLRNATAFQLQALSEGNYTIEVRARPRSGYVWSDPAKLTFSVSPVWYQTNLAMLAYLLALIGMMVLGWIFYGKRLRRKNEQLELIIKERTQALKEANRKERKARVLAEEARSQSDKSNQAKGQFLANMSHEIRTPMNGVIGMLEVLSETSLTNEQKKYIQIIQKSGENLLSIINDILNFSKIESGKMEISPKPFCLVSCLQEVLAFFTHQASSKKIHLKYIIENPGISQIIGDELRIKQVLINLIGNALKFTEVGEVIVTVFLKEKHLPDSKEPFNLFFSVKDTGIGIAKEKQKILFKAFSQVDTTSTRKYGGTGLGLAISAQLVQMMGGDITVESSTGLGATFTFSINVLQATIPQKQRITLKLDNEKNLENFARNYPLKILVAEDDLINQKVLDRILTQLGYKAKIVANGKEALAYCKANVFDLVFMDIQMPEMNGLEATTLILESIESPPMIVALTANVFAESQAAYLKAGLNKVLSKPIRKEDIVKILMECSKSKPNMTEGLT